MKPSNDPRVREVEQVLAEIDERNGMAALQRRSDREWKAFKILGPSLVALVISIIAIGYVVTRGPS